MSANIVNLPGIKPVDAPAPKERVVEILEEALALAQGGQMVAVALVYRLPGRTSRRDCVQTTSDAESIITGLGALHHELVGRYVGADVVDTDPPPAS